MGPLRNCGVPIVILQSIPCSPPPRAPHPPCLPGLKAAAVFVWSAKTLLPLLAFHQGCMGEKVGRKGLGGCWSGWVFWGRGRYLHLYLNMLIQSMAGMCPRSRSFSLPLLLFLSLLIPSLCLFSTSTDSQFPIDISSVTRDHDFLDRDAIEALCR